MAVRSEREWPGLRVVLRLVKTSRAAKVALISVVLLVIAEVVSDWVRNELTKEYPLTVALVMAVLLVVLSVILVEGYLAELKHMHEEQDRQAAEARWQPSADRMRESLRAAVGRPHDLVIDAELALAEAEQHGLKDPDRAAIAEPLELAAQRVLAAVNAWLPLVPQRAELAEAAGHGEEVAALLSFAAVRIRDGKAGSDSLDLSLVRDSLEEEHDWFDRAAYRVDSERRAALHRRVDNLVGKDG